jgi:hypothetical protein
MSTCSPIRSEHNSGAGGKENGPSTAVKSKGNGVKEADEPHKEGYINETSAKTSAQLFCFDIRCFRLCVLVIFRFYF